MEHVSVYSKETFVDRSVILLLLLCAVGFVDAVIVTKVGQK